MRIKDIKRQYRRDFIALYVCEGCGHEQIKSGYDDRYFHDHVVPDMKCEKCGKSRNDLGITGDYVETKYPEGFQI